MFIVNPISGTRGKENIIEYIEQHLDKEKYNPFVIKTQYRGHANKLAKEYAKKGFQIVVAVGGDGTINEVASALVNKNTVLGIIPAGSGNGFSRHLGIPVDKREAFNNIISNKVKKIDVGRINGKYFFCTCGTGFDAHVGKVFDEIEGRGFLNYLKAALHEFFSYKPKKYKLKIDGVKYKEKAFLVTFANAGQYGNNAYISPKAEINDGLLDICIVHPFPKASSLILGLRLFNRTMHRSRYMKVVKGKKIKIYRKKKTIMHLDGEPVTFKNDIKIKLIPKGLKVLVSK